MIWSCYQFNAMPIFFHMQFHRVSPSFCFIFGVEMYVNQILPLFQIKIGYNRFTNKEFLRDDVNNNCLIHSFFLFDIHSFLHSHPFLFLLFLSLPLYLLLSQHIQTQLIVFSPIWNMPLWKRNHCTKTLLTTSVLVGIRMVEWRYHHFDIPIQIIPVQETRNHRIPNV